MGDSVDEFNLPRSSQSGSIDAGHLSELPARMVSDQSGQLAGVLNEYYSGDTSFIEMQSQLTDLGYNDNRVTDISQSAHVEFQIRSNIGGAPSDLSPNQLVFLGTQDNFDFSRYSIHSTLSGRQYLDDSRVRNVDGTPSRLYLPAREHFNPLTEAQQEEFDEIQLARRSIYVEEDAGTGEEIDLTDLQRERVMQLATNYLNSDPDMRDASRLEFRNNVQQIDGLERINNIEGVLLDLFVDIDDEYDHRQENNGLPQGLSQDQYNFLRANSNAYNYVGQPILTDPSGVRYFYGSRGKTPIPSEDFIGRINNIPQFVDLDVTPQDREINELNFLIADWLNGTINEGVFTNRVEEITQYDPDDPIRDPYRYDMYANFMYSLTLFSEEKRYRDLNDGRPSQLSQGQYDYLMNHALVDREERYVGQPIENIGGRLSFRMSTGTYLGIPSDELIKGFIRDGFYTPNIDVSIDPNLVITDDDLYPSYQVLARPVVTPTPEQIRNIASGQRTFDPDDPLQLQDVIPPPPLPLEVIQTELGDFVIPEGIILPDELPSGEYSQNPFVNQYVEYVIDYESLYAGFRETFRDYIVPTAFSFAGAVVGYGYGVARQRLFINSVYSDMEQQLNLLDLQLHDLQQRTESMIDDRDMSIESRRIQIDLLQQEIIDSGQEQTEEGYNLLQTLNELRGLLAGTEDDPDDDTDDLYDEIYGSFGVARDLADSNAELRRLRDDFDELSELTEQIETTTERIEEYQEELFDADVNRATINTHFTDAMQRYFSDMYKIYQYRNEISIGVGVGNAVGVALSSVITGLIMPTAITDQEDIKIPPNIKREAIPEIKDKQKKNKQKYKNILKGKYDPLQEIKTSQFTPNKEDRIDFNKQLENDNLELVQPKIKNDISVKILPKTELPFRIIKNNGNKPLDYKQIQEYKSTLSKSELQDLSKQYLIFGNNNDIVKVKDNCKGVYQDNNNFIAPKIKIGYK